MEKVTQDTGIIHEAVAVFDDAVSLQDAMDDLQRAGFMLQELSVLADENTVREKVGHVYHSVDEAKLDHYAPRDVFMPDEVRGSAEGSAFGVPVYVGAVIGTGIAAAAVGTLPVVIASAVIGGIGGAGLGAIFARSIKKHHEDYVKNAMDKGGLLLWVNLRSPEQEEKARMILNKYSPHDVYIN